MSLGTGLAIGLSLIGITVIGLARSQFIFSSVKNKPEMMTTTRLTSDIQGVKQSPPMWAHDADQPRLLSKAGFSFNEASMKSEG